MPVEEVDFPMNKEFTIRLITTDDAESALAVYAPYVKSTAITFEEVVPTVEEFSSRTRKITEQYPWVVCESEGRVIGYAYASTHRARPAYRWSPESAVYVANDFHRKGIAKILYETLFSILKLQGYVNVFAGVVIPNLKSEEFHKALGFEEIGIFKQVGYKLGSWHDSKWFQKHLQIRPENPPKPIPISELIETDAFKSIIENANQLLNKVR